MRLRKHVRRGLIGATALVAGVHPSSGRAAGAATPRALRHHNTPANPSVTADVDRAQHAFENVVRPLSHPRALAAALESYFAYRARSTTHDNPYFYFVDYGLPSTAPRGYVFDMDALTIVEGPFTVAHGRGSSRSDAVIPTTFSNESGSAATSLGLYRAEDLYAFTGSASGHPYHSLGLRLEGLSGVFNDNALARRVVAHGAPYVTPQKAGRSEGCPAMEPDRARRLLPKLANGGMVFLFAPNDAWLVGDPWLDAERGP
jgi:hypothetical protein